MNDLQQLLPLWAEKEPGRCGRWHHGFTPNYNNGDYRRIDPVYRGHCWDNLAAIEYALREAIEARGWEWAVERDAMPGSELGAIMATVFGADRVTVIAKQFSKVPAIALLRAYLQALGVDLSVEVEG